MKTIFQLLFMVLIGNSCTKSDPKPTVEKVLPEANFTYINKTKGLVEFSNTSKFANEHYWEFGDGKTSDQSTPTHTYSKNGEYKVSLTVVNAHGKNTTIQTITVSDINYAIANFSYKLEKGKVVFTDSSKYAESYIWNFGDGSLSTDKNPTHTYTKNGEYQVSLTIENPFGKNTKSETITISDLNFALADFTFKIEKENVIFFNLSKFGERYLWEFGDGKSSNEQNPSHRYSDNKIYTVTLTISNTLGKHSVSKNVEITEYVKPISTNNNLILVPDNLSKTILALDASSGEIKWSSPSYSGTVRGALSFVNNVLYFGDDHHFYAIDTLNKKVKWKFNLANGTDGSPLVTNGMVYIGANHNKIYALNADNGIKKWEFNTVSAVKASPMIHNQVLYVGTNAQNDKGGTFYAINISDGSLKWQRGSYFGSMNTKAVIVGNNVYYGGSGGFHTLNKQNGELIGHHYFKVENSSPIVENNQLYAVVEGKEISSININTGNANWTRGLNSTDSYSSPLLIGNTVYVCSKNSVLALNKTDGRLLWEHRGANFNAKNVTYASGIIYAVDTKGNSSELLALEANTGKVLFTKTKNGHLGNKTVLDKKGQVYYPSKSGQ